MANLSSVITQTVGTSTAGVNLITAPNESSIWTAATITKSTTTTAAELPLGPATSTATKFTLAGSSGTAYVDFDCPAALLNTKLSLGWFARASSGFTASIGLTLQSFSSSSNRTAGTSPTAVSLQTSNVQGTAPSFFTCFDTNSQQFYRLTIAFGAQVSAWYSICQVQVGPGEKYQSAAIGEWQTYPTTVSGLGAGSTSSTSTWWRRDGSDMLIKARIVKDATPGSGTTAVTFTAPTGYNYDSSKALSNNYLGYASCTGANYGYVADAVLVSGVSPMTIKMREVGAAVDITGADMTASSELNFNIRIPISEWAGSGTLLHGAGAQVEYAYPTGTITSSTSSDGLQTAYGPEGAAMAALSDVTEKYIKWQYPPQKGDLITVQVSVDSGNSWTDNGYPYVYNAATTSTWGARYVSTSAAGVSRFFLGRYIEGTTGWTSSFRIRFVKVSPSAPVGFGMANSTDSGLIKPRKGQYALTVTGTNWTTIKAIGLYYQDQDGNHRMKFTICGDLSATSTTFTGTVAGVTFKNSANFFQAFSANLAESGVASRSVLTSMAFPGASTFSLEGSGAFNRIRIAGDVELDSKPTWA